MTEVLGKLTAVLYWRKAQGVKVKISREVTEEEQEAGASRMLGWEGGLGGQEGRGGG